MKKKAIEKLVEAKGGNLYIIVGIAFVYAILEIAEQLSRLVNAQEFIARALDRSSRRS